MAIRLGNRLQSVLVGVLSVLLIASTWYFWPPAETRQALGAGGSGQGRIYTSGFEMGSSTIGVQWTNTDFGAAGVSMSTSTVRTGKYSMRSAPSNIGDARIDIPTTLGVPRYGRAYINMAAYPTTNRRIFDVVDAGVATAMRIIVSNSGQLALLGPGLTQVGASSTALSLNTWYRVEFYFQDNGATNALELLIDGTSIASTTSNADAFTGPVDAVVWGKSAADTALDIFFDDIAVNTSDYAGEGRIVVATPNAAGDSNCTAGDFADVNEIPARNDATAGGTDVCELDTTTTTALFNATNTAELGIDSYDTINLVDVYARVREETAGTSNYFIRVLSASGGTASSSASVDAGDATARTNPSATTNFGIRHLLYTDPSTGSAWTPTGTNSIENMQIGAGTTDGNPDTWLVWIGAMVEYQDGSPPSPSTDSGIIWFD